MATESDMRDAMCLTGASLFNRGLTHGSTGNISVRLDDGGFLMTPTGSSLGSLDPARLSKLDGAAKHLCGDLPTKEAFLHAAMYAERPQARAVVHLHSTYSVAVSCLDGLDPHNVLPPLTAYSIMRVGALALVPYYPPGDAALGAARSEEHTSELQSLRHLVCRLL